MVRATHLSGFIGNLQLCFQGDPRAGLSPEVPRRRRSTWVQSAAPDLLGGILRHDVPGSDSGGLRWLDLHPRVNYGYRCQELRSAFFIHPLWYGIAEKVIQCSNNQKGRKNLAPEMKIETLVHKRNIETAVSSW